MHSNHHYKAFFDNVSDAVYTVSLDGKFTTLNKAGERLTGYKKKELIGVGFPTIVSPAFLPKVKQIIRQKLDDSKPTIYEIEIVTKDKRSIPIEISSRMIMENGRPVEIIGIARDISERKELERHKELFQNFITHELKNPLASMKVFTELLRTNHVVAEDEKATHHVSVIETQLKKITELVNDFLNINSLNIGASDECEEFLLEELINESIDAFKPLTHHTFTVMGSAGVIMHCDRRSIAQVVSNFLSNAIKYSPQGKNISISVKKSRKFVTLGVHDEGVGIAKEHGEKIFGLFYRINNVQRRVIQGHGLGLYMCAEIAARLGGSVWVESEVGQGSTFYFTIPKQVEPVPKISHKRKLKPSRVYA